MRLQIVQTTPMARTLGPILYGPGAVKQYKIFGSCPRSAGRTGRTKPRNATARRCSRPSVSARMAPTCSAAPWITRSWWPDLAGVALIAESPHDHAGTAVGEVRQGVGRVLPFTTDNLPIVDAVPGLDDAVVAAGHVFGNAAGPTTGRIVADLVCGGDTFMDISPFRADRPGLHDPVDTSVW